MVVEKSQAQPNKNSGANATTAPAVMKHVSVEFTMPALVVLLRACYLKLPWLQRLIFSRTFCAFGMLVDFPGFLHIDMHHELCSGL